MGAAQSLQTFCKALKKYFVMPDHHTMRETNNTWDFYLRKVKLSQVSIVPKHHLTGHCVLRILGGKHVPHVD